MALFDRSLGVPLRASAGFAPATLSRRLGAINAAHRLAGHPSPTTSEAVALAMKGIRLTVGVTQRQVRPLVIEDVRNVVVALSDTLSGLRDRALLLLGFAAALRRSELVALNVEDIDFIDGGLHLTIRRSKTDQEGAERQVGVAVGSSIDTCPVRALRAWLHAAQIASGPVFRRIDQDGHIGSNALQPAAVRQIVKKAVALLGLDTDAFSGHSLRAGLATSAAEAGANELTIMATTGHKSSQIVKRYVRRANLLRSTAASVAGL